MWLMISSCSLPHRAQWQMYTARMPYEGTKQAQLLLGITTDSLHLSWPEGERGALGPLALD